MKSRKWLKANTIRHIEGSIFIAPWLIGFLVFMAYPIYYSLFMSFHNVKIVATGISEEYVGLKHYKYILFENASILYEHLFPFLRESVLMIPIIVVFSMLIAILLNQKFYGRTFFRAVFFLPVIFSTGILLQELMSQGQGDLDFLEQYNIAGLLYEYLPLSWAQPIVNIMGNFILVLWYSGVQILIFLAGRQSISISVYEAARIDGAGPWEVFWKITLPGLMPFVLLNSIYTVVDLFTNPRNPIVGLVNNQNYGQSSALAWIYFLIVFVFLGIIFILFSRLSKSERSGI